MPETGKCNTQSSVITRRGQVCALSKAQDEALMAELKRAHRELEPKVRFGPIARLMPTTQRLRCARGGAAVLDGPLRRPKSSCWASTCSSATSLEAAIEAAQALADRGKLRASMALSRSGRSNISRRTRCRDRSRLDRCCAQRLASAGGRARCCDTFATSIGPRKRFRKPALRALQRWPLQGPAARSHRLADPGRAQLRRGCARGARAAIPSCRRKSSSPTRKMPRRALAERLDGAHYRDDMLRLLFICCHRSCRRRSRSRWRCASSPGSP